MSEKKTVFILHTSFSLVDVLNNLFGEQLPEVRIVNIIDDSPGRRSDSREHDRFRRAPAGRPCLAGRIGRGGCRL